MSRSFVVIVLFSFMALAQAAALTKDNSNEDFKVRFELPREGSQWEAGDIVVPLEWVTATVHDDGGATATIFLAFVDGGKVHRCATNPIATNVSISEGFFLWNIPDVPPKQDYIIEYSLEGVDSLSSTFSISGGSGNSPC
ncbi:hypothetical protein BGW80DRAFT_1248305 [Lactifluus volemus]|nr:hypothetical protein BGW80DRAFT_1248305 [Lactifluus volemus]